MPNIYQCHEKADLLVIFSVEVADIGLVERIGVSYNKAWHAILPFNLEYDTHYFIGGIENFSMLTWMLK